MDFNAAVRLAPDGPDLLTERGSVLQALGQPAVALADFDHAIEIDPEYPCGYSYRAAFLWTAKMTRLGTQYEPSRMPPKVVN